MIDVTTNEPLTVSPGGNAGPYIMVPAQQITEVHRLLKAHSIPHWIDDESISLDGEPAITVVNLGPSTDAVEVQRVLDSGN